VETGVHTSGRCAGILCPYQHRLESIILDFILMRALSLILGILWSSLVPAEGLLIIASPEVPDTAISVRQLADIYSLKKIFWADASQVVPVNREASSAEREKFS